jgi:aminodeoxychorismate synthase component I
MARMELSVTQSPLADIGSPLDAARALAAGSTSDFILLHSRAADGTSLLAFDPSMTIHIGHEGQSRLTSAIGVLPSLPSAPLQAIESVISQFIFEAPHPLVGWLGFLSYDIGRNLEDIPAHALDDLHWPLARFSLFRHYLLFSAGRVTAFALHRPDAPLLPALPSPLRFPPAARPAPSPGAARIIQQQSRGDFEKKIQRVKDYIAAGDIYQANLAQRWQVASNLPPFEVFERLCAFSPAPYASFIRFEEGTRHVASASPELFLQVNGRDAVTRPIKGTRPRDLNDPARDIALRDALLASAKDQAELTMIVDLLRNDLGRVSEFGTVQVLEPRAIEQHPTVWHTVATIASRLREDVSLADILAALCPGGSITGAPKIRAMQIIEELEPTRRGLYCGNIGVIGPQAQSLALNIAIRTILFQNGHACVHAGGGIVADSDPAREYEETLHKAAAMLRALGL